MELHMEQVQTYGFPQIRLTVNNGFKDLLDKLVAAIKDGRLPVGPYCSDWECDDDGSAWVNAEYQVNGVWYQLGADEEKLVLARLLDQDPLDGTAPPIVDLDHYWLDFLAPLKHVLSIIQ